MLRYLPNALTLSRLLLAGPLGFCILQGSYQWALATALVAAATDALDGVLARRLGALSRFGAAIDPVADKVLVTVAFVCFAMTALVPWYLALAVISRDLVIVSGAVCYRWLIGPFEFAASQLSKANMAIQIGFCALVLAARVYPWIPQVTVTAGSAAVLFFAGASGCDYVLKWSARAIGQRRKGA